MAETQWVSHFLRPLQRDVFVSLLSEVTVLALIGNTHISETGKCRYGSHISYYCMLAKPNSLATQHSCLGLNSNCCNTQTHYIKCDGSVIIPKGSTRTQWNVVLWQQDINAVEASLSLKMCLPHILSMVEFYFHRINGRTKGMFLPRKNIEINISIKGTIHLEWYLKTEQVFDKCQPWRSL